MLRPSSFLCRLDKTMQLSSPEQPTQVAEPVELRTVAAVALVVISVILLFALLILLRNVVISIFLGLLFAIALQPVVEQLRRLKLNRFVAATIAITLLVGSIIGGLIVITPFLFAQAQTLERELPQLVGSLRSQLAASRFSLARQLSTQIPSAFTMSQQLSLSTLLAQSLNWLPTIGNGLIGIATTLLFTYTWLTSSERSVRAVLLSFPIERRPMVEAIWQDIEARMGAFVRGQLILALVTGVVSLVGYWLIGLPYALLLAVIAGLLEFVPFLGPILTAVLAGAIGFSVSPQLGIAALVVGTIIQQVENIFLAPHIMDQAVGVNPIVTLLAFVGFAALFGPLGGLLAIPMAATGQVFFETWLNRRDQRGTISTSGRSATDKVRYHLQELAQDMNRHVRTAEQAPNENNTIEESLEQLVADLDSLLVTEERR
jgi:predicted PurR-regulated permease PerM